MRDRFPGYYTPSADEFKGLWEQCLFVPDANILLHLFRYGSNTTAQVLDTLERLKPRVWIPYRVGFEFHRRWRDVDQANRDAYDKLSRDIEAQGRKLSGLFDEYTRHQTIDAKKEQEEIEKFVKQFLDRIQASKVKHPTFEDAKAVFEKLSDLIGDDVGQAPTDQQLSDLVKEGKRRYEASIPPGLRDAKKDGIDAYGDYFIWQEALDKAKEANKPIVIITDDVKDDWWHEFRGQKIGPRPELVAEMKTFAGQQFYLYTLSQFLDHATNFLKKEIDPAAIQEIRQDEVQLRKAATVLKETPRRRLRTSLQRHRDLLRANMRVIDTEIDRLGGVGTDDAFLQIRNLLARRRALADDYETTARNLRALRRAEGNLSREDYEDYLQHFETLQGHSAVEQRRREATRRRLGAEQLFIEDIMQPPSKDNDDEWAETTDE